MITSFYTRKVSQNEDDPLYFAAIELGESIATKVFIVTFGVVMLAYALHSPQQVK